MSKAFFYCMGLQDCRVCMADQLWLCGEFWSGDSYTILLMGGVQIEDF